MEPEQERDIASRSPRRDNPKDRKPAGDIGRILIVIVLFGGIAYTLQLPSVREQLNVEHLRQHFQGRGLRGWLAFTGFGALVSSVGIPRLWVSAGAGMLYGALEGTIVGQIASLLGAILNFFFARLLLRGPIKRRMPARMKVWYDRFNEDGFRYLLYLRLFPLSNAMVTNLIGGISRIKLSAFLLATFIGYLPLTIVFALFGSSAAKQNWLQLAIGGVFFLIVVGARRFMPAPPKREGDPDAS